jgi:hypothetical protein
VNCGGRDRRLTVWCLWHDVLGGWCDAIDLVELLKGSRAVVHVIIGSRVVLAFIGASSVGVLLLSDARNSVMALMLPWSSKCRKT